MKKSIYNRTKSILELMIKNTQEMKSICKKSKIDINCNVIEVSLPRRCGKSYSILEIAKKYKNPLILYPTHGIMDAVTAHLNKKDKEKIRCSFFYQVKKGYLRGFDCNIVFIDGSEPLTPENKRIIINSIEPMGYGKEKFCIVIVNDS